MAVPGTIDERAVNTKRVLNPWERNENHTLCLNSAKAIGCTVVNIGTEDFIEGRVCVCAVVLVSLLRVAVELLWFFFFLTLLFCFCLFSASFSPWCDFSDHQGKIFLSLSMMIL